MDADIASPSPAATLKTNKPGRARPPHSLAARAALATGLVVAVFLGLIGVIMLRSENQRAVSDMADTLRSYALYYLTYTEFDRDGRQLLPPDLPAVPRFSQPGSGLYAIISSQQKTWRSSSAIGHHFPFAQTLKPGESRFAGPVDTPSGRLYYYAWGVAFDLPNGGSIPLTVTIAQEDLQLESLNRVYRQSIIGGLGIVGVFLIVLQLSLLRWSLTPLRQVVTDMNQIEQGQREHLANDYPVELQSLTHRINAFIDSERDQRTRYRHTLADLAHSLKTPLAVIRSALESHAQDNGLRQDVLSQVKRMDELVAYQLARAAASGRQTFATAIPIISHAEDLVRGLEKVYAAKNVLCEFDIDDAAAFYGEQGDLLELLGNLLENAFKWANHHVLLVVKITSEVGRLRNGMQISVEDDGPGIEEAKVEKILQRGVRGDERVQGHGIGLSIVQDLVKVYRGELVVDRSPEFGGARFTVNLPPLS